MSGSVVSTPCPISEVGQRIVMALSVPTVTQALSFAPSAAKASDGRPSVAPPSVKEKVSPAAPLTKLRRLTVVSGVACFSVMTLALPRGALDRAHDAWIGATATDVPIHVGDDLLTRRPPGLRQQLRSLHDLAGLAVAALRHLLGNPGLLQRMVRAGRQALDSGDLLAAHLVHRHLAGAHRSAVNMDCAGAAETRATSEFGARELQVFAHHPKQCRVGLSLDADRLAVDRERNCWHALPPRVSSRCGLLEWIVIAPQPVQHCLRSVRRPMADRRCQIA